MATTQGAPAPPAQTITTTTDQLYKETTRNVAQALQRFTFGHALVSCSDCLAFWAIGGSSTLGDVVAQALNHECPPARHLAPVVLVDDSPAG